MPPFDPQKVIARRAAQELKDGWTVNIGFGASANVPRIFLEEGRHGSVTWVIEQLAVGGIPLLDFKFGCTYNAEAFVTSPHRFAYFQFQADGFDCSLLSFLEVGADGSVNISRLAATPHRTAGAGGFVDITTRAKRIVFSGTFNAGAKLRIGNGALAIDKEGHTAKFVESVDQVSFSGYQAAERGTKVTCVTERCVIEMRDGALVVTETAPGIDLKRDVLERADMELKVADEVREMDPKLFRPEPIGLVP